MAFNADEWMKRFLQTKTEAEIRQVLAEIPIEAGAEDSQSTTPDAPESSTTEQPTT